MKNELMKFLRDEQGLTMVVYAIAGGLVGAGAITAFNVLGLEIDRIIDAIGAALTAVTIQQ